MDGDEYLPPPEERTSRFSQPSQIISPHGVSAVMMSGKWKVMEGQYELMRSMLLAARDEYLKEWGTS